MTRQTRGIERSLFAERISSFDNPHTTLCTCNDGCTYTDVGNTDSMCNWSTTPPGGPLTVDCTRVPQASISGPNKCPYEQWNPTVENWNDANVDGELSSFFMDEVTDAPTYIHNTYPTKLPRIGTGPGSNNGSIGYVGKLISAAKGDIAVDCTNIIGGNMAGCHPPPSVDEACKASAILPRNGWVYVLLTNTRRQCTTLGLLSLDRHLESDLHTCSDLCKYFNFVTSSDIIMTSALIAGDP